MFCGCFTKLSLSDPIRRLYELHGIVQGRPAEAATKVNGTPGVPLPPTKKTVAEVAHDAGVSRTQASVHNRLADLIPALMQRLDAGTITQKMAYGFAHQRSPARSPAVDHAGERCCRASLLTPKVLVVHPSIVTPLPEAEAPKQEQFLGAVFLQVNGPVPRFARGSSTARLRPGRWSLPR